MNIDIIKALTIKDISLYFRNRFIAVITILGFVFYILIYFVMPKSVNENLEIGIYTPVDLPVFEQIEDEGLEIKQVESEEFLKEGVIEGRYVAGIAIPADIMEGFIMSVQKPVINLYFAADVPGEIRNAIIVLIEELSYQQTGQELNIDISQEILGVDLAGAQIPPRDRMRPLFAVLLIMVETFGLANLISEEIERGTINALLVTPVSVRELFIAKGIVGVGLAFVQSLLLMIIIGGLGREPLVIILT
ncbi:MAG: ABC transporter permease, partial [Dehalococcoidales bacterium]|nr:ABC transporter permease [Dehalococcoidales bacterium]